MIFLGHASVDTIYRVAAIPKSAGKVLASAYTEAGGGMASNASVAAARLGAEVSYWGRVGDDPSGSQIPPGSTRKALGRARCDASRARAHRGPRC